MKNQSFLLIVMIFAGVLFIIALALMIWWFIFSKNPVEIPVQVEIPETELTEREQLELLVPQDAEEQFAQQTEEEIREKENLLLPQINIEPQTQEDVASQNFLLGEQQTDLEELEALLLPE